MKSFIKILFVAIFAMCATNSFAQYPPNYHFTGKVTPVFGVGGENSNIDYTLNYGVMVSGGVSNEINFIGIGIGAEGFSECLGQYSWTGFNMPLFAQYTYTSPYSGYECGLKIGPSFYTYDDYTKTGFYLEVTPIGYAFDRHNSIGLSYRYMRLYDVNSHSGQISYTYTF